MAVAENMVVVLAVLAVLLRQGIAAMVVVRCGLAPAEEAAVA